MAQQNKFKKSGILLVDKPAGPSSAGVVRAIERRFRVEKIGHGGTLDPFATGLLVILLNEATKISRFLLTDDKSYEAVAKIGYETNTDDNEGEASLHAEQVVEKSAWEKSRGQFVGKIQQVPPIYSAIKIKGQAAYRYARRGEEITLEPREVEVRKLDLENCDAEELRFSVDCGGGTYIRALARDWARASGTRAHLTALRRTRLGKFEIKNALPLEKILETENLESLLLPLEAGLWELPKFECPADLEERVRIGNMAELGKILSPTHFGSSPYLYLITAADSAQAGAPIAILSHRPGTESPFGFERVFLRESSEQTT